MAGRYRVSVICWLTGIINQFKNDVEEKYVKNESNNSDNVSIVVNVESYWIKNAVE